MMRINRVGFLAVLVLASAAMILMAVQASATPADGLEWTGILTSRPAGLTGTWVIGGMSFEADGSTEFEVVHGPLDVGVCAMARYYTGSGANVAIRISSLEAYKCATGGDGAGEHRVVVTYVNQLPAGFPGTMTGDWIIGGVAYTAVATTTFNDDNGPFAVGSCVQVEYVSDSNRVIHELETRHAYECASGSGGVPHTGIYGVLDQFPPELVGTWMVSGIGYTATAGTHFEQEHGPFFVGGCVRVKYDAGRTAVEISTAEARKCGGAEPTESTFYGVIGAIPPGNLGIWTIDGNSFVVTTTTQLEPDHGPLAVGVCAEVEYTLSGADKVAAKISSEELWKCTNGTFTNQVLGTINSFPAGLYGTWVVTRSGGFTDTFEADVSTEFKQEHGSFAPGVCVKVKYYVQTGVNRAVEIETQEVDDCHAGVPPALPGASKMFGTVDQLPPGTPPIGLWIIGGAPFSATMATEFENGPFAVSDCVKARYSVVSDTNLLRSVEKQDASRCVISGATVFRSWGIVEAFPANLVGVWQVSGISYTTGISTEFEQRHGFFAVGAFVEVKYVVSGTDRIALSIETHVAPGAGRDVVLGTLEAHDSNDDWSPWRVNGITYTADSAIEVESSSSTLVASLRSAAVSGARPVVGQPVLLNTYRGSDGALYVTLVQRPYQVFLPVTIRQ
jgi:hypothetical protein